LNLQQLEYDTILRIKFAEIDQERGILRGIAGGAYHFLFPSQKTELEEGWIATQSEMITTKTESHNHNTWVLSHKEIQIVAVEHENGIEFLFPVIQEILVGVAATIVTSFIQHMWNKWGAARKAAYVPGGEPSYVVEVASEAFPDGRIKTVKRLEVRGPVSTEQIGDLTTKALTEVPRSRTKNSK